MNKEELYPKILAKMEMNLRNQAAANNLDEEEINATWILNKKKVESDADRLTTFVIEAITGTSAEE